MLPKGDTSLDSPGSCVRAPNEVRPLSGSNCDAKMFAACIAEKLNVLLPSYVHPAQRGYLPERPILDNVAEIEHFSAEASCQGHLDSAMLFFDFSSAFPSVSRKLFFVSLDGLDYPPKSR